MSLWTKPLSEVTFEDIELFCDAQIPEGAQLDYKREIPNDLEKTIAAFANTLGGLILIGIDESDTNTPQLPIEGFVDGPGSTERVIQKSRDGIYPSILPEVSKPIPIDGKAERYVLAIRVPQSIETPHAIRNKTKVYVRTGNVSKPFDLADIDRIDQLRQRRSRTIDRREEIEARFLERSRHLLGSNSPFFWGGVIPLLPENPLLSEADCYRYLIGSEKTRVKGGAIVQEFIAIDGGGRDAYKAESLGEYGDYFFSYSFGESQLPKDGDGTKQWLSSWMFADYRKSMQNHCYEVKNIASNIAGYFEYFGKLMFFAGVEGAHGIKFKGRRNRLHPPPIDNSVRREGIDDANNLDAEKFACGGKPSEAISSLLSSLCHSLGIDMTLDTWHD